MTLLLKLMQFIKLLIEVHVNRQRKDTGSYSLKCLLNPDHTTFPLTNSYRNAVSSYVTK